MEDLKKILESCHAGVGGICTRLGYILGYSVIKVI